MPAIDDDSTPIQDDRPGRIPSIVIDAFCETPEAETAVAEAAADSRLAHTTVNRSMGGIARAIAAYENAQTPEVLIVEAQGMRQAILEQLERLAGVCDVNTRVIVMRPLSDPVLYHELIRRGVSESVAAPFDADGIVRSISELFIAHEPAPTGKTCAIMGVRGGAGGSTVTHNLGATLVRLFSTPTIIADFDLAFGTVGLNFNEDPLQTIADALLASGPVDRMLIESLLVRHSEGLALLTAPCLVTDTYDLPDRAADPLIDTLRLLVPMILLDIPCGWTAWTRHMLLNADEILLICLPDLGSLRSARQLLDLMHRERQPGTEPKIVLNQIGVPRREEIIPSEFARGLGSELLAAIPFDAHQFSIAANNGSVLMEGEVENGIAAEFTRIAAILLGRKLTEPVKPSLFGWLSRNKA